MTANTSNIETRQAFRRFGRLTSAIGSVLAMVASRLGDIVDGGQLGPGDQRTISRHTGGRI